MASKGSLPPLSPLPLQNYTQLGQYTTLLESLAFTPNVDYRVLEIFQQFQAVLWPLDNVATPTTQFLFPTPPRSELFDTLWELAFIHKQTLMYTHRYVTCWHDSMMMQYNTVTKSCTSCAEVYYIHILWSMLIIPTYTGTIQTLCNQSFLGNKFRTNLSNMAI